MPRYEVFIPAKPGTDGQSTTVEVEASSWLLALRSGMKEIGEQGDSLASIMCENRPDGTVVVKDPTSRRMFRIKECAEDAGAKVTSEQIAQQREQEEAEAARLREEAEKAAKERELAEKELQEKIAREKEAEEKARREREEERQRKAKEEQERKAKEEAEAKAKEEAERKTKEEAEQKAKEEAERKAKEEAEQKAKEEAERKAKEEAERKAKEEAERKAKEEAEKKAKEEKEQLAKEEAEAKAKEETERKAKEEAEQKAKEEAERKAKEEAEQKAKEEAERKAKEEAERKAKEEAERKAKEEAERKAKEEAERKAKEEEERKQKDKEERKRQKETAKKAAKAAKEREEAERKLKKIREKEEQAKKAAADSQEGKSREIKVTHSRLTAAEIEQVFGEAEDIQEPFDVEDVLSDLFLDVMDIAEMDERAATDFVLDLAMNAIAAEAGSVILSDINSALHDLHFAAAKGKVAEQLKSIRIPRGRGIVGFSVQVGCAMAVNDVDQNPNFYRAVADKTGYTTRSILCVPVQHDERTYGAMELINKKDSNRWTPGELSVLQFLAGKLGEHLNRFHEAVPLDLK